MRDFRLLELATGLSSVGMMGEQVVLGWLTLTLTDSPFMVGVALGARMVPHLLVGIPAGLIADRVERKRLLIATGAAQAVAAVTLGLLVLMGAVQVWQVLVLTFAAGCCRTVQEVSRQSYAHDLVGGAELLNGLALLGLAMRAGGLVGSLIAGALTARLGSGVAYFAVAAGYLSGVLSLRSVQPGRRGRSAARGSAWAHFLGFAGAFRGNRSLPGLIALTAGAEVLGFSHQALLPSLARDVLDVGADGLGVMTAARSVGGVLGLVFIMRLGQIRGNGTLFQAVLFLFGGSLVALGIAPGFVSVVLILVVVNAMGALADILSQSLIQLSVPSDLRGRAGGAWILAVGTAPLGQLLIGALATLLGVGAALGLSGVALIAVAGAGAAFFPRLRRL